MEFWTSDLHFYHKNICKFTDRPWTAEENEDKLVELWNSQVGPGDTVWHLGDFFFVNRSDAGLEKALDILEQLNGQIRCLLGNHDSSKFFEKLKEQSNKIVSVDYYKEIKVNKKKIVMCHYPMYTFNQSHRGTIMLHGHEHGGIHAPGKVIDVGLDGALERLGQHRFWTADDIFRYAEKLPINNPRNRERN